MLLLLVVGIGIGYFGWKYVLSRTSPNEKELLPAIHEAAQKHHLEPELVRAVIWKESRFDPRSVGTKGEVGLMQITDGAVQDWARVNRQPIPSRHELFRPETNLEIGCWYLALTGKHWDGYVSQDILQLAEYNAGRTKVLKDWAPESPESPITLEQITFPGTQSYIRQILERRNHYREILSAQHNNDHLP